MAPSKSPSNLERMSWDNDFPHELVGKVVTLEELGKHFKESDEYSSIEVIRENDKYKIYSRNYKPSSDTEFPWSYRVAYECKSCKTITIGPPEVKDNPLISSGDSMIRKEGYELSCGNCHSVLDYVDIAHN